MPQADLPQRELLDRQADWLGPARARLLRRVQIAGRGPVLDLGCGFGSVSGELVRRSGGPVLGVDRRRQALSADPAAFSGAHRVAADARQLPFADGSVELVFCQFALLWLDAPRVVPEIHRVLSPGGVLAAIEPDYGGLIEHPAEIATGRLWLSALERAGADPLVGRKLPGYLASAGFSARVDLLDRLEPPSSERFDFLRGLPLDEREQAALRQIEAADQSCREPDKVVHLPVFLVTATK